MRPFQKGRTTAPRNSFTGVPVHSAVRMGRHPVPRGFGRGLSGVEVAGVGFGEGCEERSRAEVLTHSHRHESKAARPLVKWEAGIRVELCQLLAAGDVAQSKANIGFVDGFAGDELIRMRRGHRRAGRGSSADARVFGKERLAK